MPTDREKLKLQQEDWMVKKWRPAMGWTYMGICILDMAIFPIFWNITQVVTGVEVTQWKPMTLEGAGLFHIAMGAVLGISAWSRGQEKMAGATNTNYVQTTVERYDTGADRPYVQTKYRSTRTVVGYGGKKAPPEEYQPEI